MKIIEEFNGLKGKEVSRDELMDLKKRSTKEGILSVTTRIENLLKTEPTEVLFFIQNLKEIKESLGMNAARHTGLSKVGLDECGRPKKGYYFKGGKLVKVSKKAKPKTETLTSHIKMAQKAANQIFLEYGPLKYEKRRYKLGDMYRSDFDLRGALEYVMKLDENTSLSILNKLHDSLEDNNFHSVTKHLYERIVELEKEPKKTILSKSEIALKKRLQEINRELDLDNVPEITMGMNGNYLADGHEIADDEIQEDDDFIYGMNVESKSVAAIVDEMVMKLINSGEELPPWRQTWAKYSPIPAINFLSKKAYTGSNSMLLNLIYGSMVKTPFYLTKKQITAMGGRWNEDAPEFPILYYNFTNYIKNFSKDQVKEKAILKKVNGYKKSTGKGGKTKVTLNVKNYFKIQISDYDIKRLKLDRNEYISTGYLKYYDVINLEHTTGIEYEVPKTKRYPDNVRINKAEAIIKSMVDKPKIIYNPESALYNSATDIIEIPNITDFENSQEYYATLFHELIHSTKVEARTNRDRYYEYEGEKKKRSYAFEELIAELGASYLCGLCGFLEYTAVNAASYLKGWHKTLKELTEQNDDFFVFATKEAQKAVDHIIKNFDDTQDFGSDEKEEKTEEDPDKRKRRMRMRLRVLELENKK